MSENNTVIYIEDYKLNLDTFDNVPIALNFGIAEVQNITKRSGVYSKTFTVPGTNNNNKLFGKIFNINTFDWSFDIKTKTNVSIITNGATVIEGYIQLKKVIRENYNDINSKQISYELTFFDGTSDFFIKLKEGRLRDIDLSQYNHSYVTETIMASSGNTWEDGYTYPLLKPHRQYVRGDGAQPLWDITDYTPALYLKAVNDAIFDYIGVGYDSEFFNSDYFKSLAFINNSEIKNLPANIYDFNFSAQQDVDNQLLTKIYKKNVTYILDYNIFNSFNTDIGYELYIVDTVPLGPHDPDVVRYVYNLPEYQLKDNFPFYTSSSADLLYKVNQNNRYDPTTYVGKKLNLNDVITGTHFDGNIYTITGAEEAKMDFKVEFNLNTRITNNKSYPVSFTRADADDDGLKIRFFVTKKSSTANVRNPINGNVQPTEREVIGIGYAETLDVFHPGLRSSDTEATITSYLTDSERHTFKILLEGVIVYEGDELEFFVDWEFTEEPFIKNKLDLHKNHNGWMANTYYDYTMELTIKSNTIETSIDADIRKGSLINLYTQLPDISIVEWFQSLSNIFNLYIDKSRKIDNTLLIEPRDDYYSEYKELDWSSKMDWTETELIPLRELNEDTIRFTYKKADDTASKAYFDRYNSNIIGEKEVFFDNEYLVKEKKIENIFSLPLVDMVDFMFVPDVAASEKSGGLYLGIITTDYKAYWYADTDFNDVETYTPVYNEYPRFLHVDNPLEPSEDLVFEKVIKDSIKLDKYTNNNIYNKYWNTYVQQIENSKLLIGYLKLTPTDIAKLDLRDRIWIKDSWYTINKIIDYNANIESLTKVELLQINEGLAFTPDVVAKENLPDSTNVVYPEVDKRRWDDIMFNQFDVGDKYNTTNMNDIVRGTNNLTRNDSLSIILGDNNKSVNNKSSIVLGNNNNITNSPKRMVVVGSDINKDFSADADYDSDVPNAIFGNTYIYDTDTVNGFNLVDAGENRIFSQTRKYAQNMIDPAENKVRGYEGTSIIALIDGNGDKV